MLARQSMTERRLGHQQAKEIILKWKESIQLRIRAIYVLIIPWFDFQSQFRRLFELVTGYLSVPLPSKDKIIDFQKMRVDHNKTKASYYIYIAFVQY